MMMRFRHVILLPVTIPSYDIAQMIFFTNMLDSLIEFVSISLQRIVAGPPWCAVHCCVRFLLCQCFYLLEFVG